MRVQPEQHARRYQSPVFAVTTSPMGRARRELLGQTRVTYGVEQFFPTGEIGESTATLSRRHEKLRFELVARKLKGEQLSSEEEAILAAINAGLRESMVEPTPESEHVKAAVDMAKSLLEQRAAKRSSP